VRPFCGGGDGVGVVDRQLGDHGAGRAVVDGEVLGGGE
jgi:hypothetical protein